MRTILTIIVLALVSVWLPHGLNSPEPAVAAPQTVTITDNAANGRITVETQTTKAVWHYKALSQENYNQGGGNLYELYYKPTDPVASRNLVSLVNYGNRYSTSIWAGIGGVGSTTVYATDTQPALTQSNNFADLMADNNPSGTLESKSAVKDDQGNAVINFTYLVSNQQTGKDWYRVTKQWKVEPGGAIALKIDWSLLSSGYYSEMAVRAGWSYQAGWDRFSKYGRDWSNTGSTRYRMVIGGIANQTDECWDTWNRFHADSVSLTGSSVAPTVTMTSDNNGLGFRGSGAYQLGLQAWGSAANATEEQCSIRGGQAGAHVMNWMAWWSGNPPAGSRYRWLEANTTWSDSFRIDLSSTVPTTGPDIQAVTSTSLGTGAEQISWTTNVESDSVVEVMTQDGNWRQAMADGTMTRNHSVVIGDMVPGGWTSFRVRSKDAAGNTSLGSGKIPLPSGSSDVRLTLAAQSDAEDAQTWLDLGTYSAGWQSYSDFAARKLTVEFIIYNHWDAVREARIDSVSTSSGASVSSSLPLSIGGIPPGGSVRFPVVYEIDAGVTFFRTHLYGTGIGSDGESISFSPHF